MLAPLFILHRCLVLLPVQILLPDDELLVELFHLLIELIELLFQSLLFMIFGALSHLIHLIVRIFRHLYLLI